MRNLKKKVIIVTDGDRIAKKAVEKAAKNIHGRCISMSAGNPTNLKGSDIIRLINIAKYDPVVIMVDDRGNTGKGKGEKAMEYIIHSGEVEVMGIVAVASNTNGGKGVRVDISIDKFGNIYSCAVDKNGNKINNKILKGDTVNSLNSYPDLFVVGIGDPGKMDDLDSISIGSPVVTRALQEIIKKYRNGNGI
ncbi:stage V sporulation protein AE [Clostridium pasteurianum DSM 525 = ATCC 6013]|uniref:Stage V sporulation protein AE n=1 Tax=Clostridium pasteurianum DSM 525 = ATCC 6013 TaxID=1262449 RepID=A0A0H3J4G4_CLOPA|nr:stage V sporulation protein AE [Clostridium pasteurianum]AJA47797.1 stage V sporulation protein AE [Clostridium pasteurianum DSM 525 = ATCC 6013]AJA51785.1 stage V sporulation protein AE [Clostridium pasteurianum DSM 525 = ATCC 6013]AOZ75091.1 stage V sporulation protein AE [Clostridium pasteurianum DSM 525 = ATCC 6013]AOZ78886.1 stage V sporulation protein AE [Clostridium pasteurianum]ELP59698.1 stage V sporulation protein AE [Clostridium pasteurianum DSM 525 = ATCC 6013]